jgi:maleylacetoacetate isomerase
MAEHGKIILHAFSGSSCSWRVRLALSYKGIPYEYKGWNLSKGEHMCEEYKNISPGQTVPALEIDGAVLKDSVAILEFLEERFPDKPLLPRDLVQRAAIRGIVNMISAGIQPIQNLRVLKSIAETGGEQARIEWAQKWITSGFDALEVVVKDTAGKYCFGDEFTMADVTLVPQLRNAHRFNVDMGKFPTLQRLERNLYQLDLVKNSTPEHTPDFPPQR